MLGWVGIFPKVVVVGASSSLLYSRGGFILYGICMRKKETKGKHEWSFRGVEEQFLSWSR